MPNLYGDPYIDPYITVPAGNTRLPGLSGQPLTVNINPPPFPPTKYRSFTIDMSKDRDKELITINGMGFQLTTDPDSVYSGLLYMQYDDPSTDLEPLQAGMSRTGMTFNRLYLTNTSSTGILYLVVFQENNPVSPSIVTSP